MSYIVIGQPRLTLER